MDARRLGLGLDELDDAADAGVLGALIVGIVFLIRGGAFSAREPSARKETPLEILDRRFAEGEISEEDYRARREVLAGRGRAVLPA
jgi:putative membrane protein